MKVTSEMFKAYRSNQGTICTFDEAAELAQAAFEGRFIPNIPKSLLDKDGIGRLLWTCNVQM
jgi:hypothetical protein